jgi:hypothetical protein
VLPGHDAGEIGDADAGMPRRIVDHDAADDATAMVGHDQHAVVGREVAAGPVEEGADEFGRT